MNSCGNPEHLDESKDQWWVIPTCELRRILTEAQAGESIDMILMSFYLLCDHEYPQ